MTWAGAGVVGVEVGVELEGACLVGMSSSKVKATGQRYLKRSTALGFSER